MVTPVSFPTIKDGLELYHLFGKYDNKLTT